jgi:hypothetical protein
MNTRHLHRGTRDGQQGQVLVLVVLGLVALIAAVGLVVDGGNAFAQQRGSQNGADAASTAGALVIAQNLPFRALNQPRPKTDADVASAVTTSTNNNHISTWTAFYTDLSGNPIDVAGNVVSPANAATVGGGTLPDAAWGVMVDTNIAFGTYFSRVVGVNNLTASTTATAVAGYVENAGAGNVLPVTIPLNLIYCANNGDVQIQQPAALWPLNTQVILPLCKGNATGNVGWLDWTPPAGGTSELVASILNPNNPAIPVPSWQFVTSTGNVNSQSVENALNTYAGKTVLLPFYDNACTQPNTADNSACPPGAGQGTGQNNYYHLPLFFGFKMASPKAAYITGSNPECGSQWSGAGCLIGTITNYVGPNVTVGAGTGTKLDALSAVGVQLIK